MSGFQDSSFSVFRRGAPESCLSQAVPDLVKGAVHVVLLDQDDGKRQANCIYPGSAGVTMMSSPSIDIPRTQHEFKLIQKRSQPPALV